MPKINNTVNYISNSIHLYTFVYKLEQQTIPRFQEIPIFVINIRLNVCPEDTAFNIESTV